MRVVWTDSSDVDNATRHKAKARDLKTKAKAKARDLKANDHTQSTGLLQGFQVSVHPQQSTFKTDVSKKPQIKH